MINEIETPIFSDKRGLLCVINFNDLPFAPQRIFYIKDVPALEERGNHAHKSCHQILFAINGSLDVELSNIEGQFNFCLRNPKIGIHIPPLNWGVQKNFEPGTILMVIASEPYDKNEYINDRDQFDKIIQSSE